MREKINVHTRASNECREHGYNQQALYCYRKVYSLDPTNVDALWDRASLAKDMGDFKTVRCSVVLNDVLLHLCRPATPS